MLCERCGQQQAQVTFTQVINGVKSEAHVCKQCATELGAFGLGPQLGLSFQNFFSSLLNQSWQQTIPAREEKVCSNCGLTYNQFCKLGRLGCAQCYQAFEEQLVPLIRRVQGGLEHKGKIPVVSGAISRRAQEQQNLRAQLQKAVQEERYEDAAKLRDRLQSSEEEGQE